MKIYVKDSKENKFHISYMDWGSNFVLCREIGYKDYTPFSGARGFFYESELHAPLCKDCEAKLNV